MDSKVKILIYIALIFIGLGLVAIFEAGDFQKTRLVFCDVGQGDGILITSGSRQVVVDGGPGNKILDCLGKKIPFWDRKIEMVILTHPQQDHMEGLIAVLARYEIGTIVTTNVANQTQLCGKLRWSVRGRESTSRMSVTGSCLMASEEQSCRCYGHLSPRLRSGEPIRLATPTKLQ